MSREEFDALVRRVEQRAAASPAALRWRVALLAFLGYAGFIAWLVVVLAFGAVFFAVGVSVSDDVGGAITAFVLGSLIMAAGLVSAGSVLWVRLSAPKGVTVTRANAPALFTALDELRAQIGSSVFHRIVIARDCNAGVTEVPRLGVLGWSRHYLILGLPLLDILSPDELRAVLAHELAHLSKRHGRFAAWIYRVRRSWMQMFEQMRRPQARAGTLSLRPLIVKFVDWFWPRFNAHAFVLSRANEFEADATAGRVAGAEHLASALVRIEVYNRLLEEKFWPGMWQLAAVQREMPANVFERLRQALHAGASPAESALWLAQAFHIFTSHDDTHPCLIDRLTAINKLPTGTRPGSVSESLTFPPVAQPSATEVLLASRAESIRAELNREWQTDCEKTWHARHAQGEALRHRVARLAEAVPHPDHDADALWDKARALINLNGDAVAEPLLRQILALRPDNAAANFHLGRVLLDAGDDAGEAHMERAMAADEEFTRPACEALAAHFRRNGCTERLREIHARMDRHDAALAASHAERNRVTAGDRTIPHSLDVADLAPLRQALRAEPDVTDGFLAQKQLIHFPKQRLFVLALRIRRPWHRLPDHDRERAVISRLAQSVRVPGRLLIIAASGSTRALARKIIATDGARIYGSIEAAGEKPCAAAAGAAGTA